MPPKVVFFQPRTLAKMNYMNSSGEEQRWVPWFALILAPAALELGYQVQLVDARVANCDWESCIESLGPQDVLAVSVMTGHAIMDSVRASMLAQNRGAFVVWGGPHVTLFPQETLADAPVDAVVYGFGFIPFEKLIANLANGQETLPTTPGVLLKKNSLQNICLGVLPSVERTLPTHHLDLIRDWEPYINNDVAIAPRTVNFVTSEGCPRHCTFCSEPTTSGGVWHTRLINQAVAVASELVKRAGANGLKLHDPNFFHDSARAGVFATAFSENSGLPWAATMYPEDLMNLSDNELHRFASYGLSRVLMGLESPIAEIVRLAGKKYDPSRIPDLARRLKDAGIRGMFTFIVGWPGASPEHYKATIECAHGIRSIWSEHQAKIHFLEPWPGTPIFRLVLRRGFNPPRSLAEWAKIDYYQAQFMEIHDVSVTEMIRHANSELSPYVNA